MQEFFNRKDSRISGELDPRLLNERGDINAKAEGTKKKKKKKKMKIKPMRIRTLVKFN